MISEQSTYFDIDQNQFSIVNIKAPLKSQFFEMQNLQSALSLKTGSKIIDFGCGTGRLSIYFLGLGYHVTAVDISNKSLTSLKRVYQKLRQPGWGKLVTKSVLSGSNYDGVIGSDILHHIEIKTELQKIYSVLKPGGKIAFSEPNALNIFWYLHYLIKGVPWKIESGISQNTFFNLFFLLKKSLFKNIRIWGHGTIPTRLLNFSSTLCEYNCLILGNWPVLRIFAYRFIISAEK